MTAEQKPEPREAMIPDFLVEAKSMMPNAPGALQGAIAELIAKGYAAGRRAGIEETPENVENVEKVARAICGGECQWYDACQGDLGRSLEDRPCMKRARAAIRALAKEG